MSTMKKIALSAALALAVAGSALAQTAAPAPSAPAAAAPADVANADDCLKNAFELAQKAEEKKLSNTDLDKIEELLTAMEGHCDANRFKEAMVVHKDIKSLIDAK